MPHYGGWRYVVAIIEPRLRGDNHFRHDQKQQRQSAKQPILESAVINQYQRTDNADDRTDYVDAHFSLSFMMAARSRFRIVSRILLVMLRPAKPIVNATIDQ